MPTLYVKNKMAKTWLLYKRKREKKLFSAIVGCFLILFFFVPRYIYIELNKPKKSGA